MENHISSYVDYHESSINGPLSIAMMLNHKRANPLTSHMNPIKPPFFPWFSYGFPIACHHSTRWCPFDFECFNFNLGAIVRPGLPQRVLPDAKWGTEPCEDWRSRRLAEQSSTARKWGVQSTIEVYIYIPDNERAGK